VSKMTQLDVKSKTNPAAGNALELAVGQTATLPNGLGSITFDGVKQWAQFNIAYDPGQPIALGSAAAAVLGLLGSLGIRRRRIWVRVSEQADGTRLVEVAGLARTEGATPTTEVTEAAEALAERLSVADSDDDQPPTPPEPPKQGTARQETAGQETAQRNSTPRTGASA
jgi:cytochrome c biogenesis protein